MRQLELVLMLLGQKIVCRCTARPLYRCCHGEGVGGISYMRTASRAHGCGAGRACLSDIDNHSVQ